jgi:hypothetical protein
MNEPKQTQQLNSEGWARLTLLDAPDPPRPVVIQSALRCPLCRAVMVHVVGESGDRCPRCGVVLDL